MPAYKRVLLKLSGEALMGDDAFGINPVTIDSMVMEIAAIVNIGVELAIVIGGGNIFRGVAGGAAGIGRVDGRFNFDAGAVVCRRVRHAQQLGHFSCRSRGERWRRYQHGFCRGVVRRRQPHRTRPSVGAWFRVRPDDHARRHWPYPALPDSRLQNRHLHRRVCCDSGIGHHLLGAA